MTEPLLELKVRHQDKETAIVNINQLAEWQVYQDNRASLYLQVLKDIVEAAHTVTPEGPVLVSRAAFNDAHLCAQSPAPDNNALGYMICLANELEKVIQAFLPHLATSAESQKRFNERKSDHIGAHTEMIDLHEKAKDILKLAKNGPE